MGMHVLSGCDTVSYPFIKGKISALNTLQAAGDFPKLYQVLHEEDAHVQILWKQVKGSS